MVHDLTHQDDVHRLVRDGWRACARDRTRHTGPMSQPRRHAAPLDSHRHESQTAPCGPAPRRARQIACTGPNVEEGDGRPTRHTNEGSSQAEPNRGGPAKPSVGSGDVAQ